MMFRPGNLPQPHPTNGARRPAAQQLVKANPNDPDAHLELALAFWNADMAGASYDTLSTVIRIVGPEDEDFYTQAGDKYAAIEGWLPAAAMYFQARKNYGLDGNVPEHLTNAFHESMYKGSEKPEAPIVLPFDKIARVDQPMLISSRAVLFGKLDGDTFPTGETALAQHARSLLLEAEIGSLTDKPVKHALSSTACSPTSPLRRIRVFAEDILQGLPQ
jgi:hypothetical protein